MKKLAILPALALLAACGSPEGEDTADMTSDAVTADVGTDAAAGDGAAPELANVQDAIDDECESLRARVASATCTADELGTSFSCEYAFAQDPEGTEREVTLVEAGEAWQLEEEPDFCGALQRANIQADMEPESGAAE